MPKKENRELVIPQVLQRRWDKNKPIKEIIEVTSYAKMGLNEVEISVLTNLSAMDVRRQIKRFVKDDEKAIVPTYKETKAEVMNKLQEEIVEGITPEKIAETGIRDLSGAFKVFHDAGRLEEGKATSIVSHTALAQSVAAKLLYQGDTSEDAEFSEVEDVSNG